MPLSVPAANSTVSSPAPSSKWSGSKRTKARASSLVRCCSSRTAMAKRKAAGGSRNGGDSNGQRFAVKRFDGELIHAGTIILRQRGTRVHPGENVGVGRDHTLYALIQGNVKFAPYAKGRRKKV